MRLLFIRHGDPDYANDSLTAQGKKEAELLATRLAKEKIDYIYSSPMGRALLTAIPTAKALGKEDEIVVKPHFREFNHFDGDKKICFPTGDCRSTAWDMLPSYWTTQENFYDKNKWHEADFYKAIGLKQEYDLVIDEFDELLQNHGYKRKGNYYEAIKPNTDTIAIFCHFGVQSVMLSHIFGVSPVPIWQHAIALPTAITTLYTEERRKGVASFRMTCFGSTEHLYAGGETPSFAGRFCEIFDSEDRHD